MQTNNSVGDLSFTCLTVWSVRTDLYVIIRSVICRVADVYYIGPIRSLLASDPPPGATGWSVEEGVTACIQPPILVDGVTRLLPDFCSLYNPPLVWSVYATDQQGSVRLTS